MTALHRARPAWVVLAMLAVAGAAQAATSPFGIATPDAGGGAFGGPLAPFFGWVAVHQAHFYRSLTAALGTLKDDPRGLWILLGLSFAYGVFHAVGPGHGKAVITAYLLSTGETARRGVLLSFAAALVQAVSAIVVVSVGAIILGVSATAMTLATDWIEVVSYAAIAALGAWLLWTKTIGGGHRHHHHHHRHTGDGHDHDHHHGHDHGHGHEHGSPSGAPAHRQGNPAGNGSGWAVLARAWSAIAAVGVRPCSGAIIVLVFALSQGIFAAGIAAATVMALGTGLTVAVIATAAVSAKSAALAVAGGSATVAYRLGRAIEIAGAATILIFGLTLLGGALSAGLPG